MGIMPPGKTAAAAAAKAAGLKNPPTTPGKPLNIEAAGAIVGAAATAPPSLRCAPPSPACAPAAAGGGTTRGLSATAPGGDGVTILVPMNVWVWSPQGSSFTLSRPSAADIIIVSFLHKPLPVVGDTRPTETTSTWISDWARQPLYIHLKDSCLECSRCLGFRMFSQKPIHFGCPVLHFVEVAFFIQTQESEECSLGIF